MYEICREVLVEQEGRKLEIVCYEDLITNVEKIDTPTTVTEGTVNAVGNFTKKTTVQHHFQTFVSYNNKTITLNENVFAQPGMHIHYVFMKLDEQELQVGCTISEIGYRLDNCLLPSGFINNKIKNLPNGKKNRGVTLVSNGYMPDGKELVSICVPCKTSSRKAYPEDKIIKRYHFFNFAIWFLIPVLYIAIFIFTEVSFRIDIIKQIRKFFDFIKLPLSNLKIAGIHYLIVLAVLTIFNNTILKIVRKSRSKKISKDEKKYYEEHKEEIDRENRFKDACSLKESYADDVARQFLNFQV